MRRVFLPPEQLVEGELQLPEEAARHLVRVLRLEVGAAIELFDGAGRRAQAELLELDRRRVRCRVAAPVADRAPAGPRISSALPLIKGERLDLAVRMLTELGVARVLLVDCARSVVRWDDAQGGRLQRLQRVCQAAARQSGRGVLPEIVGPLPLAGLPERAEGLRLFGDTSELATSPAAPARVEAVTLCTGPEGGFAESERALLLDAGFASLSLGPHVLRAETAAVAALASARGMLATLPASEEG